MTTTIQIEDNTWDKLNQRKEKRGETFDDVINRMLLEFPKYKKLPKINSNKEMLKQIKTEVKL